MLLHSLTEEEAGAELESRLAGDPSLGGITLARLLERHDHGEGTYALDSAAAEGWSLKAALVVQNVDVDSGGDSASRSQQFQHCLSMASHYEAKSARGNVVSLKFGA